VEKNGIRSIERITGHHRDTIGRLLEDMAEHAELMNDFLVCFIPKLYYDVLAPHHLGMKPHYADFPQIP